MEGRAVGTKVLLLGSIVHGTIHTSCETWYGVLQSSVSEDCEDSSMSIIVVLSVGVDWEVMETIGKWNYKAGEVYLGI